MFSYNIPRAINKFGEKKLLTVMLNEYKFQVVYNAGIWCAQANKFLHKNFFPTERKYFFFFFQMKKFSYLPEELIFYTCTKSYLFQKIFMLCGMLILVNLFFSFCHIFSLYSTALCWSSSRRLLHPYPYCNFFRFLLWITLISSTSFFCILSQLSW